MKILFLTSSTQDYLADSILHGMRTCFGNNCIDYPKCEVLYKNYNKKHNDIYGRGFTLYTGLLDDIEIDRINIDHKIKSNYFDLIVLGNIQRQFGWFLQYRPWLNRKNTIIIDGEDTPHPYPAHGFWWRKPYYWFLPKAHKDFLYFKREWTPETHFYLWVRLFPLKIRHYLTQSKNLRQISFSIPYEKIVKVSSIKTKLFPKHIVDEEVANLVEGSNTKYAFENENDYYVDLQASKFGITTKRAGWDCMRHYEIAANGAVICFKDLDKKVNTCAPHGLNSKNSIFYTNAKDLFDKVNNLTELEYQKLQEASISWALQHTTENVAKYILKLTNN